MYPGHHDPFQGFKMYQNLPKADVLQSQTLEPVLTLLSVLNDLHFSRGAHRVDAGVGVTGVGALVQRLHVFEDEAAV